MLHFNPFRILETLAEDKVKDTAKAVRALASSPVLKAIALGWGVMLLMLFSLLLTIRLALTLPLF